jgi:hypothetical protein
MPRNPPSFWTYDRILPTLGKRCSFPNLSMPTVAGLAPREHEVTPCDENVEAIDFDVEADIVGVTGYLVHEQRMAEIVAEFRRRGRFVAVGGPHASLCPEDWRGRCDVLFVDEAEETWPAFLRDFQAGAWKDEYRPAEKPNLSLSPVPRFDPGRGAARAAARRDQFVFSNIEPRSMTRRELYAGHRRLIAEVCDFRNDRERTLAFPLARGRQITRGLRVRRGDLRLLGRILRETVLRADPRRAWFTLRLLGATLLRCPSAFPDAVSFAIVHKALPSTSRCSGGISAAPSPNSTAGRAPSRREPGRRWRRQPRLRPPRGALSAPSRLPPPGRAARRRRRGSRPRGPPSPRGRGCAPSAPRARAGPRASARAPGRR